MYGPQPKQRNRAPNILKPIIKDDTSSHARQEVLNWDLFVALQKHVTATEVAFDGFSDTQKPS